MAKRLTLQELQGLMGFADPDTSAQVALKVNETLDIFREKLAGAQHLTAPKILFDLKGHTAGYAIGGHTIRINLDLLNNNKDEMMNQVIPHEVAHIVVHQLWGHLAHGGHHGYRWQAMMFLLGLDPDRTHCMATTPARKSSPRKRDCALWCDCAHEGGYHPVTVTIFRRFVEGKKYRCRKCGSLLRRDQ